MLRRIVLMALCCTAPVLASAQGITSSSTPSATTYISRAPDGSNGFKCNVNGCRIDLGTGAGDYIYSNGTELRVGDAICSIYGACIGSSVTTPNNVQGAGIIWLSGALGTCNAGAEGTMRWLTGTGGTNTGSQTRFCACVSSGAASPVYSWVNVLTNTAGNSTTCNP